MRDYSPNKIYTYLIGMFAYTNMLFWEFGPKFCQLFSKEKSYRNNIDDQSKSLIYMLVKAHLINNYDSNLNEIQYSCTFVESILNIYLHRILSQYDMNHLLY